VPAPGSASRRSTWLLVAIAALQVLVFAVVALLGSLPLAAGVTLLSATAPWVAFRGAARSRDSEREDRLTVERQLELGGALVLKLDCDCRVIHANAAVCDALGMTEPELIGAVWVDLAVPAEQRREVWHGWYELMGGDGETTSTVESNIVGPSGERRRIRWNTEPRTDDRGLVTGSTAVGTDVTEVRAAERRLMRSREELSELRRLAQQVAELDDARHAVVDALSTLTGARAAALWEPTGDGHAIEISVGTSPQMVGETLSLDGQLAPSARAFLRGEPVFAADASADPTAAVHLIKATGAVSELHAPVLDQHGVVGVLSVSWNRRIDLLDDRMVELIAIVAHEAVVTLRRRASLRALETAALVDPLTGIANRRAFDAELPAMLRRCELDGQQLALALIDLNGFKEVNVARGHAGGDALLMECARRWTELLRGGDLIARIDGDEFAVVLPACDEEQMETIADRLRGATPHNPGASVGVALWDGSEHPAGLMRRADQAQYLDKARRRELADEQSDDD